MHAAALLAAESAEATHAAVPPEVIGLGAFGVLLLLLAVTWAFRNVGNRH